MLYGFLLPNSQRATMAKEDHQKSIG